MSPAAVFQAATVESLCHQLGDSGPGLLGELIGLYLVQAHDLVGQIETAIADDDPPRRRAAAHKLRGSTATLGGDRLADVCLRLEAVAPAGPPDGIAGSPADPTAQPPVENAAVENAAVENAAVENAAVEDAALAAAGLELRGEFEALALVLSEYRLSLRTDARRETG
jgi:HPt (histidine-containing phosphotransfer) domain-containing protein